MASKKYLEIWNSVHVLLRTAIKNLFVFTSLPIGECHRTSLWHLYCMQHLQGKLLPFIAAAVPKTTWIVSLFIRYCVISLFCTVSDQISILWAVLIHYILKKPTRRTHTIWNSRFNLAKGLHNSPSLGVYSVIRFLITSCKWLFSPWNPAFPTKPHSEGHCCR